MVEFTGWLLDLYEDVQHSLVLWFVGEDEQRACFCQPFPVTFYAAGPSPRLRALWRWLAALPAPPCLQRQEHRDLFLPETVQLRHAARFKTFPLAFCQVTADDQGVIQDIHVQNSRWDLDPQSAPLRVMEINLDGDPNRCVPTAMTVRFHSESHRLPLFSAETSAFWLKSLLKRHDPDILLTDFGDSWLLDYLAKGVNDEHEKLLLCRDPAHPPLHIREKSYFSYGQVVYRNQQVHLYGRVHIDRKNTMMWSDYGLDGILENACVTALPIQTAARVSPGTGISSMQMITALENDILIPWHKQQAEQPKSMLDLVHADFGGMVYQPTVGIHRDVAEIDFVSMYPSVMVRCDISPEKEPLSFSDPPASEPGLVPLTLAPLLGKRISLKQQIPMFAAWDPRRKSYKARSSAIKWLLVVCFGYLGYKNARFGRIEAHEAVTGRGREALLRAKEAAEDAGFEILHMYVDGLWIRRPDCSHPAEFQPVLDEITRRTGLPIALDGIYRWVIFLPSRGDSRVPVGNRYFGIFQDGTIKVRGLEARRRDTPPWVARMQMALIEHLAQAPDVDLLADYLPGALSLLHQALAALQAGQVMPEDLLVAQRLTRPLEKYSSPSAAARAALQLQAAGKEPQAGQRIRFLYLYGKSNVWAWDRPEPVDVRCINLSAYRKLLLRAAGDIFQPFGMSLKELNLLMEGNFRVLSLPNFPLPDLNGKYIFSCIP